MNSNSNIKHWQEALGQLMAGDGSLDSTNGLQVEQCQFESCLSLKIVRKGLYDGDLYYHELVDQQHEGNKRFHYPVVVPEGKKRYQQGIILLHGLNEKSWEKYYAWAAALATRTHRPVILFPLAYHMNRAPKSWSDPRVMKEVVGSRNRVGALADSSFANAALSTRLGTHPELFVYSGVQSYYDVCALFDQIGKGEHPLFEAEAKLDFFAYSIGAFLAQILSIANPGGRFTASRLFLFAGGPTFDRMQGSSRYIMDIQAFRSLLTLKQRKTLKMIHATLKQAELPAFEAMWKGFYAMLHHRKGGKYRKEWLKNNSPYIQVLALKNDRVMPVRAIVHTFKTRRNDQAVRIDVIDLPYETTHENPFPLNDEKILGLVNRSFGVLIEKAANFYQQALASEAIVHHDVRLRNVQLMPA